MPAMKAATPLLTAEIGETRLDIVVADITTLDVDAIVNAANRSLLGGGGVDGAIHRAAGPELQAECRAIGGCPTGEARITGGYRLPAKHVIHAVGPVWHGGSAGEDETLANCYRESLRLAAAAGLRSIAFPSISTGAFGYPVAAAARVALTAVRETLRAGCDPVSLVRWVLFSESDFAAYVRAADELVGRGDR
jgi:O-acetyl-ADP-ribose deacetylase (regulator of RNase III)